MDSYLSSPDPLNDSPTYHSPVKTRRTSKARYSLPAEGSSPSKQTFELDVGNAISRQKIRVTVEAGNSDIENGYEESRHVSPSPVRRSAHKPLNWRREQTMTTTVPVKGLSDSEEEEAATTPKRARGRPRKSGTPIPGNKRGRAGTPTQKKRRSIGTLVDGDDSEDFDFHLGQGVSVGRRKGRSRSKSTIRDARQSNQVDEEVKTTTITAGKKGRRRRKSLLPEDIVVHEDETSGGNVENGEDQLAEMTRALLSVDDQFNTLERHSPYQPDSARPITYGSSNMSTHSSRRSSIEEQIVSATASPQHQHEFEEGEDEEEDEEEEEEEEFEDDAGDEHRDFDTIMESEGFSMISVDSVPSFREHFSSPANTGEPKETLTPIRCNSVSNLQVNESNGREDSFSSIPGDLLETLTPGPKLQDPRLLAVHSTRADDSFSSIPSGLLETVTPGRITQGTPIEALSGRSLLELQKREPKMTSTSKNSYRAISAKNLESPLPSPAQYSDTALGNIGHIKTSLASIQGQIQEPNLEQQSLPDSSTQRLLTPDDTPPPEPQPYNGDHQPHNTSAQEATSENHVLKANPESDSSVISYMKSSPPVIAPRRYTYTAHLRQRRELHPNETETPSIVFSSPTLPPPIQFANGHPVLSSRLQQDQQPKLSPTVRAGRVLQGIIVPTLSPRGRAHSLGSPFKSPITDRNSSSSAALDIASSPTQERKLKLLPRFDLSGNHHSESLRHSYSSQTPHHDDPFSNNSPVQQRSASPDDKQAYTLGLPGKRCLSDPRLSTIMSEGTYCQSDDAMSWQAEDEVQVNDARTTLLSHTKLSTNPRSSSSNTRISSSSAPETTEMLENKWAAERAAVSQQVKEANVDDVIVIDSDDEQSIVESNDEYDLLLETINSSSPATQDHDLRIETSEIPRRSKIPSPWRKNSRRLVYNDELSQLNSSPIAKMNPDSNKVAKNTADEIVNADLSELPIPQKANFKPLIRNRGTLDISVLLASSPNKAPLPVLSKSSNNGSSLPPMGLESYNIATVQGRQEEYAPIPQKMGFTPRRKLYGSKNAESLLSLSPEKSAPILNGMFGVSRSARNSDKTPTPEPESSSSYVQPVELSSPSRTDLRPAQNSKEKPVSTPVSTDFYDTSSVISGQNDVGEHRTMQWAESLCLTSTQMPNYISPTKSCLRSPLKTPSAGSGNSLSPSKNVAFVSSSPIPSSPINEPLSSTVWSHDHWRLLKSILNTWKPENQVGEERRRRNSTRVISKLLGKSISSGGQKLRLEQWHLEVVDEFRGEAPGWEELVIAKRVFSLVCGEKLRAKGVTEKKE